MKRRTLITDEDGAYLAECPLAKGYEVHDSKRRASLFNTERINQSYEDPHECYRRLVLDSGDLTAATNLIRIDNACLDAPGWHTRIPLEQGLRNAVDAFASGRA